VKIAVLKEAEGEARCAAIPETVKKYVALGANVAIERGAGEGASIADSEFEAAGATLGSRADVLKDAEVILAVNGPDPASLNGAPSDALLIGALDPLRRREAIDGYAKAGVDALAADGAFDVAAGFRREVDDDAAGPHAGDLRVAD
jgi:NAD(P) transhydrogenase subunit alpha